MRRRYGNTGFLLWIGMIVGIILSPILFWIILQPLKAFVSYLSFGTDVLGIEPKSFLLYLYVFVPILLVIFVLYKSVERLGKKINKGNVDKN